MDRYTVITKYEFCLYVSIITMQYSILILETPSYRILHDISFIHDRKHVASTGQKELVSLKSMES